MVRIPFSRIREASSYKVRCSFSRAPKGLLSRSEVQNDRIILQKMLVKMLPAARSVARAAGVFCVASRPESEVVVVMVVFSVVRMRLRVRRGEIKLVDKGEFIHANWKKARKPWQDNGREGATV